MIKYISYLLAMALVLTSCGKSSEDEVYHPPALTGMAYVLAANANHIAVVNLKNQELDRLVIDKTAVDLAAINSPGRKGLAILAEDGSLGFLPENALNDAVGEQTNAVKWQDFLSKGVGLATGENGTIWLLGRKEVLHLSADDKVVGRYPFSASFSAIFFDADHSLVWLISRERALAEGHDLKAFDLKKTVRELGNSVHLGMSFPGAAELWIAEGNEFRNGKPYGVGFAKNGPAVAGGFNIFASDTGKQTDFVDVGGNVVDLVPGPNGKKVYAATNRLPFYNEATLAVVGSKSRRSEVLLRLCLACHEIQGVEIKGGQAEVRAIAVLWLEQPANNRIEE